jgi:hypothetical protein
VATTNSSKDIASANGNISISMPISRIITIASGVGVGLLGVAVLAGFVVKRKREAIKAREAAIAGERAVSLYDSYSAAAPEPACRQVRAAEASRPCWR